MRQKNMEHNGKIKIIHIAQSAGGVAQYLKDMLKNINEDIFDNILIVSNDYKGKENEILNYKRIFFVDMIRQIKFKNIISNIRQIKQIIKNEKPDIIYLHSSIAGAIGRLAVIFNRKIKVIYNAHGWYFNADIGKKVYIYRIIEKLLAYRADKIIAISESEYESALEKHICKQDKIVLIENAIDIDKYNNIEQYRNCTRNRYNIKDDDIVVGIVGRISEQKDPFTTIKAASQIIHENSKIYFMFVGTGDLEKSILDYAKEHKIINNIFVTGWVSDIRPYISTFDIALLPSKWEGFGLAIAEYMACKKPIIATKLGGIADILKQENGAFFIDKGSADDIVKGIKYIINSNDAIIEEMVENNYIECRKRFSLDRFIEQYEELFEQIVDCKNI